MTDEPTRVVDAHVHLWDPARTDWYPYLSGRWSSDMGDVTGMARRFDVATYRAEAAGWNVEKLVNVAAATGRHSIDETLEIDRRAEADGHPDAIIGGIPPDGLGGRGAWSCSTGRWRRPASGACAPWGAPRARSRPPRCCARSRTADLVFELMAHPDQLQAAARASAAFDDLVVVVEHTGWPRSTATRSGPSGRRASTRSPRLGANVTASCPAWRCRSGRWRADAFAPWIEPAIEAFGVDRCFFASNFPVDGMHGTLRRAVHRLRRGHRRPRRRVPRQALRHQRRAHLPLLSHRHPS